MLLPGEDLFMHVVEQFPPPIAAHSFRRIHQMPVPVMRVYAFMKIVAFNKTLKNVH